MRVLPEGETPTLHAVRGTNFCDVALVADERNHTWILLSALDNLGKGASGQAVQCANLLAGVEETLGLLEVATEPLISGHFRGVRRGCTPPEKRRLTGRGLTPP